MMKNPSKILMQLTKRVSDLDWRVVLLLLPLLSFIVFVSVSSFISPATVGVVLSSFSSSSFSSPFRSIFKTHDVPHAQQLLFPPLSSPSRQSLVSFQSKKDELDSSRIAVCLVGGARRFELTGPSIIQNILKFYPNSDLFLHAPLDSNSYKLSLLKSSPRIASVKIFSPETIPETETQKRVLRAQDSPNGIQGLLQYFSLVENCLNMIKDYQMQHNFTYDWVVRTRVDGYWSEPLGPEYFIPGQYFVPSGSSYGGLNDRLGIGDLNTSIVALSRLSLIPWIDGAGFQQLNSECAFKAQLTTQNVSYATRRFPFCVVTDRKYDFPPSRFGVPVAAMSSRGPLSGAKCRPCTPVCTTAEEEEKDNNNNNNNNCVVGTVMNGLYRWWSWTDWSNNSLQLCDAHGEWEEDWEKIYDEVGGKSFADERKRVEALDISQCVVDMEEMRNRSVSWVAPPALDICRLGLPV